MVGEGAGVGAGVGEVVGDVGVDVGGDVVVAGGGVVVFGASHSSSMTAPSNVGVKQYSSPS